MARLPEDLIARIKSEVPLTDLCREHGIELRGSGKNLLGKCPFHDDDEPSFAVTPSKNLWNCLAGCGGGDNIKLIMELEKLSFRHAADKLAARLGIVPEAKVIETRQGTTHEILTDPGSGLSDTRLMNTVADFYHKTFLNQPQAMAYLQKRKCFHPEAAKMFKIGYANRTIGYRVPKTTKAGKDLKAQLTKLGIYGQKGHEHLSGSVVFPIFDRQGNPVQMYGRKTIEKLRKGTPMHLYLQQPKRGIWNRQGIEKQAEWLLCESIIDALTLWCHGFRNVTCAFGTNGFNADLWSQLDETRPTRIVICYDNDPAGNKAAADISQRLAEKGIGTLRARLPEGLDINRLAVESSNPQKALAAAVEGAETLVALAKSSEPQAQEKPSILVAPEPTSAKVAAAPPEKEASKEVVANLELERRGEDELHATIGDRAYRVRGLNKNHSYETIKIQLKVSFNDTYHLDNGFDLCAFKAREHFVKAAAAETTLRPEIIKGDLGKLLLALEELQEENIRRITEPEAVTVDIDPDDRAAALDLLKSPDLLEKILIDFNACGVIGEDTNKLVGYLAATSRKFDKPLGIIVQSTSAAGKTTLMESILDFMPEEERVKYSAMTGQALFYLGETSIKNKILAIAEEEGAERATYALKLLQSEGELTIASTGKDATTGRMQTEEYHVQGPAMIFFTTTNIEIDEELANRCLTLTVDESREQTRRIHQLQRESETIEGYLARQRKKQLITLHQNAQRLLENIPVHNPYARQLTFPDENTRLRRDQVKYLTLIRTIAFLHQHQRPKVKIENTEYIEVIASDIATANTIAGEVLGRSLDELPPQTRRFLNLLWDMVEAIAKEKQITPEQVRIGQREAREQTSWSHMQVKRHMAKLVEFEYLISHSGGRGQSWQYELAYQGQSHEGKRFLPGLIDAAKLKTPPTTANPIASASPSTIIYDEKRGTQTEGRGIQKTKRGTSGAPQGHTRGGGGSPPEKPLEPIPKKGKKLAASLTPSKMNKGEKINA